MGSARSSPSSPPPSGRHSVAPGSSRSDRGRRGHRRPQPVAGDGLQERDRRAAPRRRQGGDHRRPDDRQDARPAARLWPRSCSRSAAATSPPPMSAPTSPTWTSSPRRATSSPDAAKRPAEPATPACSPHSACTGDARGRDVQVAGRWALRPAHRRHRGRQGRPPPDRLGDRRRGERRRHRRRRGGDRVGSAQPSRGRTARRRRRGHDAPSSTSSPRARSVARSPTATSRRSKRR